MNISYCLVSEQRKKGSNDRPNPRTLRPPARVRARFRRGREREREELTPASLRDLRTPRETREEEEEEEEEEEDSPCERDT